jgi:predicted aspartyl protease
MVVTMIHRLSALVLVMFWSFMSPAAIAADSAAQATQTIKLERFRKALWTVRVTLNGKTGDFLFDTGGGITLVTEQFAAGWGCKFWGRVTGYNMFGERSDTAHCDDVAISADGVALKRVSVGKFDFGDRFAGDKSPDGILSLDAFDGQVITLDQQAATLTVETPASLALRTKSMPELPLRLSRECSARCLSTFLGVPSSAGMAWLLLDSGAGGVSLISKDHAQVFGLDPNAKEQRLKFELAAVISVDSPVMVTDMIMDGNLGQPFMSRHVITFDLAQGRVWIAPQT